MDTFINATPNADSSKKHEIYFFLDKTSYIWALNFPHVN